MEGQIKDKIVTMRHQFPPFVWPEQRVLAGIAKYDEFPPFDHLIESATGIIGLVPELDDFGIDWFRRILERQPKLQIKIVLLLYPACATNQDHLEELNNLCEQWQDRLTIRLFLLRDIEDISIQSLLIVPENEGRPCLLLGCVGNFGVRLNMRPDRVNFVISGESAMVESWTRWFNWVWATKTAEFRPNVVNIPPLVRPQGSEEARKMWDNYISLCKSETPPLEVHIDPDTGDVIAVPTEEELKGKSEEEQEQIKEEKQKELPSVGIGINKLDPTGDEIARLFQLGEQATIDKSTKIKPLSAPISPRLFGEEAERREGRLAKKVSYRVEIFEAKDQKRIDNLISSAREVLNVFSYPLADGVRWVPLSAKKLLSEELKARNLEGMAVLKKLVGNGAEEYLKQIEPALRKDSNQMYKALFPEREMSGEDFDKIKAEVLDRLKAGLEGNIIPKLTFTPIGFNVPMSNETESGWGTAYSLLLGIAKYPRGATAAGGYFARNFKQVKVEDVFKSMDVLNDPFYLDKRLGSDWAWAKKEELPKFSIIEEAKVETHNKCRALLHLIKTGDWDEATERLKIINP